MNLPQPFIEKMTALLGEEAALFFATYDDEKASGLRINPLKISTEEFLNKFSFPLEPVPFVTGGYYYDPEVIQPGKHPFHQAGLYYIQEPSAMFVAETLSPKPGEKVLDLSAAPGGKATHLAGLMGNEGLLIANEIHPKRVKALSENIERFGITNALVTNETPERLAKHFAGYFDKILVDAPCSGEGMFRKDPVAIDFWSPDHVNSCAAQQGDILASAYEMLKEGGVLVYSTCTFSPEENERAIEAFMEKHPDLELLPIDKQAGIASGRSEWTQTGKHDVELTARLWPHRLRGEGHFTAKLRKKGASKPWSGKLARGNATKQQLADYRSFEKQALTTTIERDIVAFKQQLYALPDDCPDFQGLKVVRPGLHLGELKKNRFEPNHALAQALPAEHGKASVSLDLNGDDWRKYLKGETLQTGGDRGWMLVTIEGYPLGWGKEAKGILKNFYPKGLRIV